MRSCLQAVVIAAWVLLPAPPVWAQPSAKAPITHEDVWLMKRVGPPAVSPDGRWAVFAMTEPAYDDKQVSDLWVVPADGSTPPRRLTNTAAGESGVAWSPDSARIVFTARREGDEAAQLYLLDLVGGGEAQRLTSLTNGARAPSFSPDGTRLLFTSDVYPGATTEAENKAAAKQRKERKYNARAYDDFPIRHWDRWLDDRRPSLFVVPVTPGAEPRDVLAGSALVKGAGFGGQLGNGGEELSAAWTPDGKAVVFAATTTRNQAAFAEVAQSLWMVPVTGGEPERLTTDGDSYATPTFSPDGKTLFAHMEPATDRVYNASRLVSWAWPGRGPRTVLTKDFDRSVGRFVIGPDGRTVFLLAEDAGREKLYSVPATGGTIREVGTLDAGCLTNLDAGGTQAPVLVANWDSTVNPPEVVRLDPATGKASPLTTFNAERAAKIDWQPVREFWFTSSRGKRIHSFVALPPGFDPSKKYPLFVLIHGGPHGPWRDQFVIRWNYHLLAAPGYVVLLTNYTGSTSFGERFAQDIQGDPLDGPAREINEAADAAIAQFPFIDGTRQAAGGASYGGHLANWLAATTTRYKALVSHAGLFDLKTQWLTSDVVYSRERNMGGPAWEAGAGWKDQSPFYRSPNLKTPILVTVGERDYRVPMNNAIEFWSVLQRQKVPSRLIVFPDENHWILKGENSRYFYAEVRAWLARWLGTPPAPAE
jgi:dipeptidyl aminopeptidase/acylaminoacyl peptidase